jgi:nucleotide-binding universal stress UspA family protein
MAEAHTNATKKRLHDLETSLEKVGGPVIRTKSVHGSAIDQICSAAKEAGAHLIVMGSHGASGAERVFFGSTAEAVVREASTPVLVTRASHKSEGRFQSAVVGVDFSEFSNTLARLAAALLAPQAELHLLHVVHRPFLGALDAAVTHLADEMQKAEEETRENAVRKMDEFVESLDVGNVVIKGNIETGSVEDQLLKASANCDLIAVGAHCQKRLGERILGTTADRVVRHSGKPVLVLPEEAMYTD